MSMFGVGVGVNKVFIDLYLKVSLNYSIMQMAKGTLGLKNNNA